MAYFGADYDDDEMYDDPRPSGMYDPGMTATSGPYFLEDQLDREADMYDRDRYLDEDVFDLDSRDFDIPSIESRVPISSGLYERGLTSTAGPSTYDDFIDPALHSHSAYDTDFDDNLYEDDFGSMYHGHNPYLSDIAGRPPSRVGGWMQGLPARDSDYDSVWSASSPEQAYREERYLDGYVRPFNSAPRANPPRRRDDSVVTGPRGSRAPSGRSFPRPPPMLGHPMGDPMANALMSARPARGTYSYEAGGLGPGASRVGASLYPEDEEDEEMEMGMEMENMARRRNG